MTFKVDTLIAIFSWIVRQLLKTADSHLEKAQQHQEVIDKASAAKNLVLKEAKRAETIAQKVQQLIS